eukprot:TRINITY_DN1423_c0_g2_i2.p1 TRINITY_DN1423_c0_g2~~TRINITY_DN1423_c0_g2_i2.p1  ORF type:complete len:190 (+),score=49.54 TRINITY_DN1423_c0_g2_i2:73-642(+)
MCIRDSNLSVFIKQGRNILMEFKNEEYGDKRIHIYLYKDVKSKSAVADMISRYPNNLAVCNASLVLSVKHLLLAANRAIYNHAFYAMKTEKLSTEIIYHLAPQNAITAALENFGSMNANHMIFVWIATDEGKRAEEMEKVEGVPLELEKLSTISNTSSILQIFEVTDKEKAMVNGDLDAVYDRIALKNI